jgi:hypothetical protein
MKQLALIAIIVIAAFSLTACEAILWTDLMVECGVHGKPLCM